MSLVQIIAESQSTDNETRRKAEEQLLTASLDPENMNAVLDIICDESQDMRIRLASTTYLKTCLSKVYNAYDSEFSVGRRDRDNDGLAKDSNLSQEGIETLKERVMKVLYSTPDNISILISDLCEMMARNQFNENWKSFIPDLVKGLEQEDPVITMRVFRTLNPCLIKIRHSYRSDELYSMINYVIEDFCPALTHVMGTTITSLSAEGLTLEQEQILYKSIIDGFSIYQSLNSVEEFPDYFEETLQQWGKYLYDVLEAGSDHAPSEFIEAKKTAVDVICLLVSRFSSFMVDYIETFFTKIWGMMNDLPPSKVYNEFVSSMTEYLSVSLRNSKCSDYINEHLSDLFSKFLVHHLSFNEDDFEEFEGNEESFIKMDLEENDKETRRRSCFDLIKKLTQKFPQDIDNILANMEESFCKAYADDPENNWMNEAVLINTIIATTILGYSTRRGATRIRIEERDLIEYLKNIIVPEIDAKKADSFPILASQALKFLVFFRNFIPKEWLPDVLEKLTTFLVHESVVVRTYSACAIEKLLSMKDPENGKLIFTAEVLAPSLENLLKQLNLLISETDGLHNYALMSLFRVVSIAKDTFKPYAEPLAEALVNFLAKAIKDNECTAYSIYILFETIGYTISAFGQTDTVSVYEKQLLGPMNDIVMKGERTDIIVYIFQIYSAFVMNSTSDELSDTYKCIVQSILEDPSNSSEEMRYLVPGGVKVVNSVLAKYPMFFSSYKENLFGLFTRVLKDLRLEEDALGMLSTIIEVFPIDSIGSELVSAVEEVLKQMVMYKGPERNKQIPHGFLKSVFVFIGRYVLNHGTQSLFDLFNTVKDGILLNFFEKEGYFIGKISKNEFYRRHIIAGFAKIITEYEGLKDTQSIVVISQGLIQSIAPFGKIRLGRDDADEGDPVEYQDDMTSFERASYQPLFSLLNLEKDSLQKLPEGVTNYTLYVLQCMQAVTKSQSKEFVKQVGKGLPEETKEFFGQKLEEYGISLD